MKNMAFVIWMLLYPLIETVCNYIDYLKNAEKYSADVIVIGAIVNIVVWILVGKILYEK